MQKHKRGEQRRGDRGILQFPLHLSILFFLPVSERQQQNLQSRCHGFFGSIFSFWLNNEVMGAGLGDRREFTLGQRSSA